MNSLVVIPARMASTRFPGKPLVDLLGKPMLQWVVEAAVRANVGEVVVATPDSEILAACDLIGVEGILTRGDHPSGTDRIAELSEHKKADLYINVQGDEPLIDPEDIVACAKPLLTDSTIEMGSLFSCCADQDADNPAVVKVVVDRQGFALYFSRHAIPYARNERVGPLLRHVGLYAYNYGVLQRFKEWRITPLEATESLEQLRFLENGVRIKMSEGSGSGSGVDTPEQAEEVRKILSKEI